MKVVFIKLIELWQCTATIREALLHTFGLTIHTCKYSPTCSEYTKQAIKKYGSIKGIYLGTKRLLRCNPISKGGYDPLT